MKDERKTKKQLVSELAALRQQVEDLRGQDWDAGPGDLWQFCEYMPLPYQSLDSGGRVLHVNQAWVDHFGYDREEVTGQPFGDFVTPECRDVFAERVARCETVDEMHGVVLDLAREDRSVAHVAFDMRIERDRDGGIRRAHCILQDLTERVEMETPPRADRDGLEKELREHDTALQETEGFYKDILDGIVGGVCVTDRNDVSYYANRGMEMISGLSREQIIGTQLLTGFPEETVECYRRYYSEAKDALQPVHFDAISVVIPDGRRRHLSGWFIPRTRDGCFDGMICTVADVTERRQAEEELQKHRERLEELVRDRAWELAFEREQLLSIFDGISEPICVSDPETHEVLYVNVALKKLLGLDPVGRKCYQVLHGRDTVCEFCTNEAIKKRNKQTLRWEHHNALLDRDYLLFNRMIKWPDGRDVRFELAIDITDRKLAEEALTRERDLLNAMLEHVPDGIYFKDRESRFMRSSAAQVDFLGAKEEAEVWGKTDFDFFEPDHAAAAYADEQGIIETGEPVVRKLERIRKWDGTFYWVSTTKAPLYDREGQIIGTVGVTRDVEEQVRLRAELDGQRRMLQAVLDAVPEFIIFKDKDSAFQLANRLALDFLGLSAEEVIGKSDFDLYPSEDAQRYRDEELRAMETGETVIDERPVQGPSGTRWEEAIKVPMRDEDGEIIGVLSIERDVTERREMEEQLRLTQVVMDSAAVNVSWISPEGRILYVNEGTCRQLGYSREELLDMYVWEVAAGADHAAEMRPSRWESISQDPPLTFEVPLRRKDGSTFPGLVTSQYFAYEDLECEVAFVTDISEWKRAEEALAYERDLLKALLDNTPDLVYFKDAESRFLRISRSHLQFLGLDDQADAEGRTDFDFFDPDHAAAAYADEQRIVATGEPMVGKLEHIRRSDGTYRWVTATKVPLRDREGQIIGTVGVTRDVDDQVRLQTERDEQHRMLQAVLDAVPEFIAFKDMDGVFQSCNKTVLDLLGVSAREAVGKTDFDFYAPADAQRYREAEVQAMESGEPVTNEWTVNGALGMRWVESVKIPMRDEGGEIIGVLSICRDVGERRKMEEQLRLTQSTVDSAAINIFWVSPEGRFLYVNDATCRQLGYSRAELLEMSVWDVDKLPEHSASTRASHWERLKQERCLSFEARHWRKDGLTFPAEVTVQYLAYGDREFEVSFVTDIADRNRAERILAEERNLLRTLIDVLPDHIFVKDLEGRMLLVNRAQALDLGLNDPNDLIGKTDFDVNPPHFAEQYYRHDLAVMESGKPLRTEETFVDPKGEVRWASSIKVPWFDEDGRVVGLVGMSRDITERKEAEETLRHRLDLEMVLAYASRQLADPSQTDLNEVLRVVGEAIGVQRADVFQLRDEGCKMDNIHEWCAPGIESHIDNLQDLDTSVFPWWMGRLERDKLIVVSNVDDLPEEAAAEKEMVHTQGVRSILVLPLRWSSGALCGFVGFADTESERKWSDDDIRALRIVAGMLAVHWDRRRIDEALWESEDLLRRVINAVPAMVAVKDRDGNFVQVNARVAEIYGTTIDEMIGRNHFDFVDISGLCEEEIHGFLEADRKVIETRQPLFIPEEVFTTPDGTQTWFQTVKTPLATSDNPDCVLVVGFDISERKKLEEQLRQSQKMEAVGTLAGGVAHDFNNLLTGIIGYSEFLLQELEPGGAEYEDVLGIKRSADRAADLTRQLLAFSRRQILQPKILDLNDVVRDIMKMLERLVGEDIDLDVKLVPVLGKVKVDPGQIEQVVMNLIVNAREAMPTGGLLSIETKNVVLDESYAREQAEVRPGTYAMLAISDTGAGMDRETLSRVFEPFFTTKELGTGLGLSTVYGIVKQSGGHVSVYSEPGSGTTFKVYLPLEEEPQNVTISPPARPEVGGSETVLLVEDDEMVRRLARRSLEHFGYSVLEANNGEEALRICEEREGAVNLLLTDVVMSSGMSGRQLAERIQSIRPEVKVLYMSGYTDTAIVRHGVLGAGVQFLEKPFTPETLALRVREVLDS